MKTEKKLEEKIIKAEELLPGVGDQLKPKFIKTIGGGYQIDVTDVEYLEVGEHKVVAAKWQRECLAYGRSEIMEFVTVYFPSEEGKLKKVVPENIFVRNFYKSCYDRDDLFDKFPYVSLENLAKDQIKVAWLDKDKKK
ncbi:hypothetical protein HOK51_06780 [Candidatus Woesearchaeota archaeon]|jgi:hypothetical protein|nr:hypothetical protein [Candidatus Woesearchaeota archaeon]MBT6519527.1 hypothetical protein [Candidatus Woesearchaeota archaeon]MBT7367728.1 hypothetical protein [Candidatus Woesearchaeota archaeon]